MAVACIPPGPRRVVPGSSLLAFRHNPLLFLERVVREYGDIVRLRVGLRETWIINHPEHIRDVLVTNQRLFMKGDALQRAKRVLGEGLLTSEGDLHLRQRRLVQPAFHRQRIAGYAEAMVNYAERLSQRWQAGAQLDMAEEMMRLALAIVGRTLFDVEVEDQADAVGEALNDLMATFPLLMVPFSQLLDYLPLPVTRRAKAAIARLDTIIYQMIAERRASGKDHGDLLSMLLQASDAEGDGSGMSDLQLRDELLTLFLAGHETTANTLAWTWYLLAQNPQAEVSLHQELDHVLGGRAPRFDDLLALPYTRMVVSESMRLFPPAWAIGRRALADYEVGGYLIPAGALVIVCPALVHRDPRFFPEPMRFDPLRFSHESQIARPKFAYFPFGGGTRQCIGEQFAWTESILVLASLAQRWRPRLLPNQRIERMPLITLRPRYGIQMQLEARA